MPRYPGQSSLPPLAKTLPTYMGLEPTRSKITQVADYLRTVATQFRTTHNLTFYATRDIAKFFNISQHTSALAVETLEKEGLLRRIRGSQTLLLGKRVITRTRIRAVAGLMSWTFAQRYSSFQKDLDRTLAQDLWPQKITLNIIPFEDSREVPEDLDAVLSKHRVDFAIWPFPFPHYQEHLRALEERGVRNLVIGTEGVRSPIPANILINFRTPFEQLFSYWKEEHGIRRIVLVTAREFEPRAENRLFARLARKAGLECRVVSSGFNLSQRLLEQEKEKIGIALLDEHAAAEFTFYDPRSFTELLTRHRILYGQGGLNVPFVPDGEHRVERIFIPLRPGHSISETPVVPAIAERLSQWSFGDFSAKPSVIPAILWRRGELWRYL